MAEAQGEVAAQQAAGAGAAPAVWERVAAELQRLEAHQRELKQALAALKPLARPDGFDDLKKLDQRLAKLRSALGDERTAALGLGGLLDGLQAWRDGARKRLRQEVGKDLKQACEAAGLELRVVSREEPVEVRIPPLAVVFDFDAGAAELRFARLPLRRVAARAGEVVLAHRALVTELERAFDPAAFLDHCWKAYVATCAALGKKRGERVEIVDFLPNLALRLQAKKFQVEPIAKNWKDYSRAQFAYDVLRLRRAGALAHEGRRLNFGVATGTTAAAKSRVIYLEDEHGSGEYKLTIYFTEA